MSRRPASPQGSRPGGRRLSPGGVRPDSPRGHPRAPGADISEHSVCRCRRVTVRSQRARPSRSSVRGTAYAHAHPAACFRAVRPGPGHRRCSWSRMRAWPPRRRRSSRTSGRTESTTTTSSGTSTTTDHFEIYYYPELEQHLARIAGYAESAYQQISADLKHDLPFKVQLILFKTHSEFEQENIFGQADGRRRRVRRAGAPADGHADRRASGPAVRPGRPRADASVPVRHHSAVAGPAELSPLGRAKAAPRSSAGSGRRWI